MAKIKIQDVPEVATISMLLGVDADNKWAKLPWVEHPPYYGRVAEFTMTRNEQLFFFGSDKEKHTVNISPSLVARPYEYIMLHGLRYTSTRYQNLTLIINYNGTSYTLAFAGLENGTLYRLDVFLYNNNGTIILNGIINPSVQN